MFQFYWCNKSLQNPRSLFPKCEVSIDVDFVAYPVLGYDLFAEEMASYLHRQLEAISSSDGLLMLLILSWPLPELR